MVSIIQRYQRSLKRRASVFQRHIVALFRNPPEYFLDHLVFQNQSQRIRGLVRSATIAAFGTKPLKIRNQYHIRRNFRKGHLIVNNYPKLLHVEMTTYCNIRCRMCSIVRPGRTRNIQHIDLDVIKRLEPVLPFVSDTKMHGGGEPFMNPRIEEIIRVFQKHDVQLNTVTNATLFNDRLAKLVGRNFATLTVSMDGATKQTYEYVRERSSFDKVIRSLELLNKHRHPDFKLIIGFVILRSNAHELPQLVELAKRYNAQEVQAAWMVPFKDLPWTDENDPTREPVRMNAYLREAVAIGEEIGVSVKIPPFLPEAGAGAKAVKAHKPTYHNLHPTVDVEGHCRLMYDRAMVLVDGQVKPCGQSRSVPDLGTLKEQSFEDIWRGPGYQRLRGTFNNGTLPKTCRSCNFIRSGQLGSAKLLIKTQDGDREPIMDLIGER